MWACGHGNKIRKQCVPRSLCTKRWICTWCRDWIRPQRPLCLKTQPIATQSRAYYAGNAKRISMKALEIMWKMRGDVEQGGKKVSRMRYHPNTDSVYRWEDETSVVVYLQVFILPVLFHIYIHVYISYFHWTACKRILGIVNEQKLLTPNATKTTNEWPAHKYFLSLCLFLCTSYTNFFGTKAKSLM